MQCQLFLKGYTWYNAICKVGISIVWPDSGYKWHRKCISPGCTTEGWNQYGMHVNTVYGMIKRWEVHRGKFNARVNIFERVVDLPIPVMFFRRSQRRVEIERQQLFYSWKSAKFNSPSQFQRLHKCSASVKLRKIRISRRDVHTGGILLDRGWEMGNGSELTSFLYKWSESR